MFTYHENTVQNFDTEIYGKGREFGNDTIKSASPSQRYKEQVEFRICFGQFSPGIFTFLSLSKTLNIKMYNSVSFPSTDDRLKQQQPNLSPGVHSISDRTFAGKINVFIFATHKMGNSYL